MLVRITLASVSAREQRGTTAIRQVFLSNIIRAKFESLCWVISGSILKLLPIDCHIICECHWLCMPEKVGMFITFKV